MPPDAPVTSAVWPAPVFALAMDRPSRCGPRSANRRQLSTRVLHALAAPGVVAIPQIRTSATDLGVRADGLLPQWIRSADPPRQRLRRVRTRATVGQQKEQRPDVEVGADLAFALAAATSARHGARFGSTYRSKM